MNLALLLIAGFGAGLFVFAEARTASPLIQLAVFRDPVRTASLAMNGLVSTVMMATLVVAPFYLSRTLGLNEALVGTVMPYLMASYVPKGSRIPGVNPEGQIATGVMVASNSRKITRDQLQSSEDYETPANVPVPMSATSYAGSTPSARYNTAPAVAPGAHVLVAPQVPSANNASQAFDQMVVLPEIGPMPYERPLGSLALGYQNDDVKTVTVDLAFDAVMARNDGLTQESILASAKRHQAKFAAR